MEDLFDILIPLIIAGVYFFGNVLSRKSGDALDETGQPLSRERDQEEDLEDAERQREVQEEIRRMIEERRNDAPANPTLEPQAEPARMVRERTKQTHERVHEARTQLPEVVVQAETVDSTYEADMQAQLAKIERTRKKAAALRAQSKAASKKLKIDRTGTPRAGSLGLKGPVRMALSHPGAARSAFVYAEVLGAPVGLRKNGLGAFERTS